MKKEDNGLYIGKVVENKEIIFNEFIKANQIKKSDGFVLGVLGEGKGFRLGELKGTKKRIYRIDHCYFYDSNENCLLIESELEPNVLAKIIVAIQFKFEELVSESLDIDFLHLLDILKRFYNVKDVKEEYKNILNKTDDYEYEDDYCSNDEYCYIYKFDLKEIEVMKIEIYSARESHCGTNFRDIYKYLVQDKELEAMISDYMKYPEGYNEYIKYISSERL